MLNRTIFRTISKMSKINRVVYEHYLKVVEVVSLYKKVEKVHLKIPNKYIVIHSNT